MYDESEEILKKELQKNPIIVDCNHCSACKRNKSNKYFGRDTCFNKKRRTHE